MIKNADGSYTITNTQTGEKRTVQESDLPSYGLKPEQATPSPQLQQFQQENPAQQSADTLLQSLGTGYQPLVSSSFNPGQTVASGISDVGNAIKGLTQLPQVAASIVSDPEFSKKFQNSQAFGPLAPLLAALQTKTGQNVVTAAGKGMINEYGNIAAHPVASLEQHPVNTLLDLLPLVPALKGLSGLGKVGEAADIANVADIPDVLGMGRPASPEVSLLPKDMSHLLPNPNIYTGTEEGSSAVEGLIRDPITGELVPKNTGGAVADTSKVAQVGAPQSVSDLEDLSPEQRQSMQQKILDQLQQNQTHSSPNTEGVTPPIGGKEELQNVLQKFSKTITANPEDVTPARTSGGLMMQEELGLSPKEIQQLGGYQQFEEWAKHGLVGKGPDEMRAIAAKVTGKDAAGPQLVNYIMSNIGQVNQSDVVKGILNAAGDLDATDQQGQINRFIQKLGIASQETAERPKNGWEKLFGTTANKGVWYDPKQPIDAAVAEGVMKEYRDAAAELSDVTDARSIEKKKFYQTISNKLSSSLDTAANKTKAKQSVLDHLHDPSTLKLIKEQISPHAADQAKNIQSLSDIRSWQSSWVKLRQALDMFEAKPKQVPITRSLARTPVVGPFLAPFGQAFEPLLAPTARSAPFIGGKLAQQSPNVLNALSSLLQTPTRQALEYGTQ